MLAGEVIDIVLVVNGTARVLPVEARVSLLDTLREHAGLTGTKKGCNYGCGACTVLVDGRRIVSCLGLAVQYSGREIITIEGLSAGGTSHPLQAAFIRHDGFQCGYCTPGQICSAVGMLAEHRAGSASAVTADVAASPRLSDAEIRERTGRGRGGRHHRRRRRGRQCHLPRHQQARPRPADHAGQVALTAAALNHRASAT